MIVAFIGGGNMAGAIIGGLLAQGWQAGDFIVVDPGAEQRRLLAERHGIRAVPAVEEGVRAADFVVLAVKPQQMREAAAALCPLPPDTPVLSIAAGIRLADLSRWLQGHACLVRAMPNTPALIRQGISGLFAGEAVPQAAREAASCLLGAVGQTLWVGDESLLDAVTAVSGSGPAYVFYAIEAVQAAAESLGFTPAEARTLTLQTFVGAAALAAGSDEAPATLRQRVTSKGGTTERALDVMETAGVKRHIMEAVQSACARSRELGDDLGRDT